MDQESTGLQQENKQLSKIIDILLELFPDPFKNFIEVENLKIQANGKYIGMNEVSKPGSPWFKKLEELNEQLPYDSSNPIIKKFPNENIQRKEIFNQIYAKLYQTLVIGKYKMQPCEADRQDLYGEFLQLTKRFLNKFDDGTLSPVNLLLWTQIVLNIDPKTKFENQYHQKMVCYMNTTFISTPQEKEVGQQIMVELEQLVGQINNSPVLEQIYVEFSKQLGIPCGQQLSYAFKFCKLHYIYDQQIQGITLLDGTIILNLYQITMKVRSNETLPDYKMQALTVYYLILLLHESAHFFLRKQFNEYEINTREKVNKVSNYTEIGVMLENILMPPISEDNIEGIPNLNNLMANFLLDLNNWKLPLNEFQLKLQVLSQAKGATYRIKFKGDHTRPSCVFQKPHKEEH